MSEITSTVYGPAPWSGELLTLSGDVRRGRQSADNLLAQTKADFGLYSATMDAAGIDYRSGDWDGQTTDYLRDVAQLFTGFKQNLNEGTLTRWFDTNTFYRQPVIEDVPAQIGFYQHSLYQDWLKLTRSDGEYQPTFLSPYAFAALCGKAEGLDDEQAADFVDILYAQLLAEASDEGVKSVLLHEPFIPYAESSKDERDRFITSIGKVAASNAPLQIGLFFSYGDASQIINEVIEADLPISAIGADLQKTPFDQIAPVRGKIFLAGLVDGANTLFHPEEKLAAQVEKIASSQEAAGISITHTVDFEHLPRRYAIQKIQHIGRVARLVKGVDNE